MAKHKHKIRGDELLDGLATAVIAIHADQTVDRLNSAAEMMFGVSDGFACGAKLFTVLPALSVLREPILKALEEQEAYMARDLRLRRSNGSEDRFVADVSLSPQRDGMLAMEFSTRDRPHRIFREDAQWQQQEVNHEMIRGLAHEIKNPLGGLRGAAQLLERELPSEDLRDFTGIIIREADRLQDLVDRLLGPSRPVPFKPTNIHVVVEHVRTLLEAQAPAAISIERDYDPSLPDVPADPEQLIQAVLNIGVNALDAMREQETGRLILRTRAMRQFTIGGVRHRLVLRVDICDTGPGIPSDMMEKIFYPMVSSRAEGSGLGLAIAQTLIRNHGGLIECESRPGDTVFSLYLPIQRTTA
nr:PAS domain-containing sensor histidine kinase [Oceanococcus sp. HetDA_MAG_MS8]